MQALNFFHTYRTLETQTLQLKNIGRRIIDMPAAHELKLHEEVARYFELLAQAQVHLNKAEAIAVG